MTEPERPVRDEPTQEPPSEPATTEPPPAGGEDAGTIGEPETEASRDQAETEVIDVSDSTSGPEAAYEDFPNEGEAGQDEDAAAPPAGPVAAGGTAAAAASRARRGAYQSETAPTPSDIAVRLRDRPSELFVIAVAIVFAAILLNGIFLGKGGILTPIPSPTPVPSVSAEPSSSVGPSASGSVAPSSSASSSASGGPAASGSAVPSQAPSVGPSQPASAGPSPSP